ncbi:rhodanese-like domain-containing protein [Saccharomonospora saliphila]|uniref:rhodanese-like domain-containing protein n=1 Tax=Saccharomonospora saliphila TaxID=369829 RepID=UPI00039E4657|nr:rhodanese-like domain-containing protein [Saccharomonospora saliphila]
MVYESAGVPTATVDELPTDGLVLLDVRESDEWAAGHAPEAIHVPLSELPSRTAELAELPDDRPVHVICRSGGRSARAAAWLNAAGVVDAVNVEGGMHAWRSRGRPLVGDHADEPPEVL